jgi:hypothetical protein
MRTRSAIVLSWMLVVVVVVGLIGGCETWKHEPRYVASDPVGTDGRMQTMWQTSGGGEATAPAGTPTK